MSSVGMATVDTVWSEVCSAAYRWIAVRMIARLRSLASSCACSPIFWISAPAFALAFLLNPLQEHLASLLVIQDP